MSRLGKIKSHEVFPHVRFVKYADRSTGNQMAKLVIVQCLEKTDAVFWMK